MCYILCLRRKLRFTTATTLTRGHRLAHYIVVTISFSLVCISISTNIITIIIIFINAIVSIIVIITQAPSNIDLLEPGFGPTLGLPAWTTCNPKRRYQV